MLTRALIFNRFIWDEEQVTRLISEKQLDKFYEGDSFQILIFQGQTYGWEHSFFTNTFLVLLFCGPIKEK